MINWQNKQGLQRALDEAGIHVVDADGIHVSNTHDDVTVNNFIVAHDALPVVKTQKIDELKAEAVTRAQAYLDFINTFAALQYNREVFLSIAPAARNMTTNMSSVQNVTIAAIDAKDVINASNDIAFVEAYDVVTGPAWPA